MARDFRELLKRDYVILDGAMGTMLQAAGMKMGETCLLYTSDAADE